MSDDPAQRDWIEEQARVLAVTPGRAWVQTQRRNACAGCSASSGCGTATVARLFGERSNRLEITDGIGVAVGDQVVIGLPQGTLTLASLLAYLLPLGLLLIATAAAQSAGLGEAATALIGLLGLCAGLWVAGRLTGSKAGRERYQPVLLRRAAGSAVSADALRVSGGRS